MVARKHTSHRRFYLVMAAVAVAGVALIGYAAVRSSAGSSSGTMSDIPVETLEELAAASLGTSDARVVVAEFADFQCPGCAAFAMNDLERLKSELVADGQLRYLFIDLPLTSIHPNAFAAARAARCADEQQAYWSFHDALYSRQREWAAAADPQPIFRALGDSIGVNADDLASCLASDRHARAVTRSAEAARAAGVRGTPVLFVNGKALNGVPGFDELRQLVLAAEEGAR